MRGSAAIRAALVAGLSLAVCSALTWLLVSPYIDRENASEASRESAPPRTDVPSLPGYRSVWANDQPVADRIRPDDRLLEVVLPSSPPFAPSYADPLRQIESLIEWADAAVVVRLEEVLPAQPPGISYVDETAVTNATVEAVVFDRARSPWRPGDAIRVESDPGTRETQIGATRVVQRREHVRAPRRGGRYLLFLMRSSHGGRATAAYGYGNAFEIRGSRVVNMSVDTPAAWSGSASVVTVMSLVRRQARALNLRASGDIDLSPRFLR